MNYISFIRNSRSYFEDFVTRSTYHSNRIEGNTLSYAETYAILFNDNAFKVSAKPREIYEAINHKYALSYVMEQTNQPLSEQMIQQIGIIINKNINEIDGYRKESVFIRGAEYVPPQATQVPQQMMYFVYNYNHSEHSSVFHKIADFHIQFERIHPFSDGNGRTGRLLINYELLKNNLPPVVLPEDKRGDYFEMIAVRDIDTLAEMLKALSAKEQERIQIFLQSNTETNQ